MQRQRVIRRRNQRQSYKRLVGDMARAQYDILSHDARKKGLKTFRTLVTNFEMRTGIRTPKIKYIQR